LKKSKEEGEKDDIQEKTIVTPEGRALLGTLSYHQHQGNSVFRRPLPTPGYSSPWWLTSLLPSEGFINVIVLYSWTSQKILLIPVSEEFDLDSLFLYFKISNEVASRKFTRSAIEGLKKLEELGTDWVTALPFVERSLYPSHFREAEPDYEQLIRDLRPTYGVEE
jgi:hypothetical protein